MAFRTQYAAASFAWSLVLASGCPSKAPDDRVHQDASVVEDEPLFPCTEPVAELGIDGEPTGFIACESGAVHRAEARACPPRPAAAGTEGPAQCAPDSACTTHSDCDERPNGFCSLAGGVLVPPGGRRCGCHYDCETDADCEDGSICDCYEHGGGTCASAIDCTTDADCGDGLLCQQHNVRPTCPGIAYACQTAQDECATNDDCPSNRAPFCTHDGTKFVCEAQSCAE